MPEPAQTPPPRDGWVIIYWDAEHTRWEIGLGYYTDRVQAAERCRLYRRELGPSRAGIVHTADRLV